MVGFHQSYTYFTWRNDQAGARGVPARALARDERRHAAEPLRQHPRHPAPSTSSTAVRPAFEDPRRPRGDGSPAWGVYAGFELYEHVAVRPGIEEYLDSEKYQLRPRDWEAAERRRPDPGAVHHQAQRDPPRTPRPAAAAQPDLPPQRRRRGPLLHQAQRRTTGSSGADDTVIVVVNLDPHGTRETIVHLDMPASA